MKNKYRNRGTAHDFLITCHVTMSVYILMRKTLQKAKYLREFVNLYILVDMDTKKILTVRFTDDRTGDSPMFIPLLNDALKNCVPQTSKSGHAGGSMRCSTYGDGAYASRDNLKACRDRNVTPLIKFKVSPTQMEKVQATCGAWQSEISLAALIPIE